MKSRATNEWKVEEAINSLGRNTSFKGEVYYFSIVMIKYHDRRKSYESFKLTVTED